VILATVCQKKRKKMRGEEKKKGHTAVVIGATTLSYDAGNGHANQDIQKKPSKGQRRSLINKLFEARNEGWQTLLCQFASINGTPQKKEGGKEKKKRKQSIEKNLGHSIAGTFLFLFFSHSFSFVKNLYKATCAAPLMLA
jgi:hypothetical protein